MLRDSDEFWSLKVDWIFEVAPYFVPGAALFVAWVILRQRATPLGGAGVDQWVGKGKPTVLRFFTNT